MNNKNEQSSFLVYRDWEALFDSLESNEEAGTLIKALFAFVNRGEKPSFKGSLKTAFIFMSQQITRDGEKWQISREKRSKYMKDKWEQKKSTMVDYGRLSVTDTVTGTVTVTDTVTDTVTNNNSVDNVGGHKCPPTTELPHPPKGFKQPTLNEVKTYCEQRGNNINPEKFIDYYKSNGWMVGKNPMKDWKATIRRWERTQYDDNNGQDPDLTIGEDGFFYDHNGDRYI